MKKTLSILIAAATVFALMSAVPFAGSAAWDGEASAAFTGSGTSSDPYIIASAENLKYLQLQVADGDDFEGKYFTQTADIDLGGKEWTPIGTSGLYFSGIYDGLGHSVTGLSITRTDINALGLFGYIQSGYKHETGIMNLKVYGDIVIKGLTVDAGMGGVVGWVYKDSTDGFMNPKLINIENYVNFDIDAAGKQPRFGAVAGYIFNAEVTGVKNYGSIVYTGSGHTRIGGIVGQTNRSAFRYCENNGDITVNATGAASAQAAGISGMTTWKVAGVYSEFDHCVNNGKITCSAESGACFAGGILAAIYTPGSVFESRVHDCINNGAVSAKVTDQNVTDKNAYAAGIIPRLALSSVEITDNVNTSLEITSEGVTGDFAAGIVSDITKNDPDTIVVRNNISITGNIIAKTVFEVAGAGGTPAATDAALADAKAKITSGFPVSYSDLKIDGFPGKAEETTAPVTTDKVTTAEVTEVTSDEPEVTTEEVTAAGDDVTTAAPQTEPAAAGGCKSAIGAGIGVAAAIGLAALTVRKKD